MSWSQIIFKRSSREQSRPAMAHQVVVHDRAAVTQWLFDFALLAAQVTFCVRLQNHVVPHSLGVRKSRPEGSGWCVGHARHGPKAKKPTFCFEVRWMKCMGKEWQRCQDLLLRTQDASGLHIPKIESNYQTNCKLFTGREQQGTKDPSSQTTPAT